MASVREVSVTVGQIRKTIAECLGRCRAYPSPSKERLVRIINAESAFNSLSMKFDAAVGAATTPSLPGIKEHEEKVRRAQAVIDESTQAINAARTKRASLDAEVRGARLQSADDPEMRLRTEQRVSKDKVTVKQLEAEAGARLNAARKEMQQLEAEGRELYTRAEQERKNFWEMPNSSVSEVERELSEHLDKIGALEKDIEREARIGEELRQVTKADFESKSKDFEAAETFHRSQARRLFWAILVVATVSIGIIYYLFIINQIPAASTPEEASVVTLERMVFFGLGRVALLFFCAWAVKYLADLHRSHSEQSIIYRDRKAALGVAQNILNASPKLAQKQELLRTLAVGYLDFEQNAFRAGRKAPGAGVDGEEVKRIEGIVNAIRPLIDSLKGITDKAK